jgi:hypothetical protein
MHEYWGPFLNYFDWNRGIDYRVLKFRQLYLEVFLELDQIDSAELIHRHLHQAVPPQAQHVHSLNM